MKKPFKTVLTRNSAYSCLRGYTTADCLDHTLMFPITRVECPHCSFSYVMCVDSIYLEDYLFFLKYHVSCQYEILTDITAVCWQTHPRCIDIKPGSNQYAVVYELLSIRYNNRIRVKVISDDSCIPSVEAIYPSANWGECELWDMYGVFVKNHVRLTRLLTDYGFEGFPLRKDFPLSGYFEIRYNEITKCIVVDKLELSQKYSVFLHPSFLL